MKVNMSLLVVLLVLALFTGFLTKSVFELKKVWREQKKAINGYWATQSVRAKLVS